MAEDYVYDLDNVPDDYYDMYEEYEDYYMDGAADYTLRNLWYDCLVPTILDGLTSSSKLIACCILLRFQLSLSKLN